jgi:hypothetical protein
MNFRPTWRICSRVSGLVLHAVRLMSHLAEVQSRIATCTYNHLIKVVKRTNPSNQSDFEEKVPPSLSHCIQRKTGYIRSPTLVLAEAVISAPISSLNAMLLQRFPEILTEKPADLENFVPSLQCRQGIMAPLKFSLGQSYGLRCGTASCDIITTFIVSPGTKPIGGSPLSPACATRLPVLCQSYIVSSTPKRSDSSISNSDLGQNRHTLRGRERQEFEIELEVFTPGYGDRCLIPNFPRLSTVEFDTVGE